MTPTITVFYSLFGQVDANDDDALRWADVGTGSIERGLRAVPRTQLIEPPKRICLLQFLRSPGVPRDHQRKAGALKKEVAVLHGCLKNAGRSVTTSKETTRTTTAQAKHSCQELQVLTVVIERIF